MQWEARGKKKKRHSFLPSLSPFWPVVDFFFKNFFFLSKSDFSPSRRVHVKNRGRVQQMQSEEEEEEEEEEKAVKLDFLHLARRTDLVRGVRKGGGRKKRGLKDQERRGEGGGAGEKKEREGGRRRRRHNAACHAKEE